MSILSTNHRLISIGESYSAGNGIDIADQVISVTGDATPYSAGENIDIQDHIISGKDWSNDITEASSHAYNETTAWVQENYANSADMTYISAVVETKLDASAWSTVSADYATEDYVIMADNITYDRATGYVDTQQFAKESACQSAFDYLNTNKLDDISFRAWQNGQYSTDLQTIEGQISNKLDESAFSQVSGSFLTAINIPESATWNEVSQAYEQASATYLTSISIPESAVWQDVSTTVQTNSAQWAEGGGGAISSYTTEWCHDVPPYGDNVINRLNDKYLKAFISDSADRANFANNANNANSANYAETVNETYVENKGFTRNLSSEYGTISVIHNNIIESTNSAISRVGNEGFVSSFEGASIGPEGNGTVTFSWDKSLPNTIINLDFPWSNGDTLTYSANTNLTGEIVLPTGVNTQTINIPNATEFKVWSNRWINFNGAVVSAADQFETVVGELAWASALPTYEYDTTNKISAINGSALAGGEISHDNTLSGNGTVGSPLGVVPGYNETVLFQTSSVDDTKWNVTLSEDIGNFDRIKILARRANNSNLVNLDCPNVYEDDTSAISGNKKMITCDCDMDGDEYKYFTVFSLSGNKYTEHSARLMYYGSKPDNWQTTNCWLHPTKIIGINRKA